jgi:hypothetical protein
MSGSNVNRLSEPPACLRRLSPSLIRFARGSC